MKGRPIAFENFVVYPEYCGLTHSELGCASVDGKFHVAALPFGGKNWAVVYQAGRRVWNRMKHRLHASETRAGLTPGQAKPSATTLDGLNVLVLICYEILFPQDYLRQHMYTQVWPSDSPHKVDLVIHMVGQPMYDENQREGWKALQKSIALLYRCPVVCCCGGPRGRMNITGVTKP